MPFSSLNCFEVLCDEQACANLGVVGVRERCYEKNMFVPLLAPPTLTSNLSL